MIRNPFYYGVFNHKGELYRGSHEPIISNKLFDKVQRIVERRGKPRKAKEILAFAFREIFTCSECGRAITADKKVKLSGRVADTENLEEKRSFLQKIGYKPQWYTTYFTIVVYSALRAANFHIIDQKAAVELGFPWVWAAKKQDFSVWSGQRGSNPYHQLGRLR